MKNRTLFLLSFLSLSSPHLVHAMPPMFEEGRHSEHSEQDNERRSSTAARNRITAPPFNSRASLINHGTNLSIAGSQISVGLPIEAGEYCDFLNAILPADRQPFYDAILQGQQNITRTAGAPCRIALGRAEQHLTISQTAALHYCNWLENNSPSYQENPDSTEYGTYDMDGRNGILSINAKASFFVPSILGVDPDVVPISELGVVLRESEKNPSIKKIPERAPSSIQNKEVFSNADFTEEWNRIQEEQSKWNIHLQKALVKKSKKSPIIMNEAPRIKISLDQKISLLEEQLKSIIRTKQEQLRKLIEAYETLLDTVKHTYNIVEARVALSKTSTFFATNTEAQSKLNNALQWAILTPAQRVVEFEIEIQRKPIEKTLSFETTDEVWKLAKKTSKLILSSSLAVKKFSKDAIQARVHVDFFKSTMADGSRTVTDIIDNLSSIASTAEALDPRLSLPLDGIKELLHLIVNASATLLTAGAESYGNYLEKHEAYLHSLHTCAKEQFVSLSAYAEALEKNSLLEEAEKTLQKILTAKSTAPIPDSSLWELWGKRVSLSKTTLALTYDNHHKNIIEIENQLKIAENELLLIQQKQNQLSSAMEQARIALNQATLLYQPEKTTHRTSEELRSNGTVLMKATQETAALAEQLRKISEEQETKESERENLREKLTDAKNLSQRMIVRAENFAKIDEDAWYFVWPQRAPSNIDRNVLLIRSERVNPLEIRNSVLLAQQLAVVRSTFIQAQACYARFEDAFLSHLKEEKSFAKPMRKQAELFAKASEKMETAASSIATPQPTDQYYHMTKGGSVICNISKNLKTFLDLIVKEVSPNSTNAEEALEHQLDFLKTDFSDKAHDLEINGWFNEIKWAQEVVEKLSELVNALRAKQV